MTSGNAALDAAMSNILDCFGGADGGASFARLSSMVVMLDAQEKAGDATAGKVLQVVYQFSRLIDASAKT